ncbi:MAG: hypothetical protein AB8B83_06860 [Bdellovibrionales bacterium]
MRFPGLIIFILLIPAIGFLIHDCYLLYANHISQASFISLDLIINNFKLSAFGFIWATYAPETYKTVAAGTDPETWAKIDSFLTLTGFYTSLAFAGTIIAFLIFFAFFGLGPMANDGGRVYASKEKKSPKIGKGKNKGKMKFTRK